MLSETKPTTGGSERAGDGRGLDGGVSEFAAGGLHAVDLRLEAVLDLRGRARKVDERAAGRDEVDGEAFGLEIGGENRDIGVGETELRADDGRREPVMIAGVAGSVERFDLGVEGGLALGWALEEQLDVLHGKRGLDFAEVGKGADAGTHGAGDGRDLGAVDVLRDERARRGAELRAHLRVERWSRG